MQNSLHLRSAGLCAEMCELLARYAKVAADHGHDPDSIEHLAAAVCHIADSRAEAEAELRAAMPAWIRQGVGGYVSISPAPRPVRDAAAYVEQLLRIHPIGTLQQCIERLRASAKQTGINKVLLMVEGTGDRRRSRETVLRLGTEVAPHLVS